MWKETSESTEFSERMSINRFLIQSKASLWALPCLKAASFVCSSLTRYMDVYTRIYSDKTGQITKTSEVKSK